VFRLAAALAVLAAASVSAQPTPGPLRLLDVPYIPQSEALCGGAAAAMVMRFWGATGIYAESFQALVDESAGGIRGDVLLDDLRARGWDARSFRGDAALVTSRMSSGQPVIALIEDRPGFYHFVVVVAWAGGRVIYHDPARAPFRVVDAPAFLAAWEKSGRWSLLLLPPAEGVPASASIPSGIAVTDPTSPCDALVQRGVRAVAGGQPQEALAILTSAAELCPASSAALREAAGVQALEENWPEARRLAREAVTRNPDDGHAWRILATGAYVAGDDDGALAAWNAAGEPTIDLVNIQGLGRTRHAVASALLGLSPGAVLTRSRLAAASRRLGELPSAEIARVTYRPLGGGLASVDAVVLERPRWPTAPLALASTAIRLGTDRELAVSVSGLSGGGERLEATWRWWKGRPRVGVSLAAPSPAGVWRVEAFGEEQAYGVAPGNVEARRGGSVSLSNWTSTLTRWQVGAGLDVWPGTGRTVSARLDVDQRLDADRLSISASGSMYGGSFVAWTGGARADWRSSVGREGLVIFANAGAELASSDAPRALWPGAGTGHARPTLLRAHPLLDAGRIAGDVFGRTVWHAGGELRRWTRPAAFKVVRIAPALFLDAARASRRLSEGDAWHVDVGLGVRLAVPGSGVLRVDVGRGLRDGSSHLSAGWIHPFD